MQIHSNQQPVSFHAINSLFDDIPNRKLSKKEKRRIRNKEITQTNTLQIKNISPLTKNQRLAFESYNSEKNMLLLGCAGTGKSFLSVYLALEEILNDHKSPFKSLVIFRSAVQGREIGHLPGKVSDKLEPYKSIYRSICSELFNRGDAYSILETKKIINFEPTSFLRGMTYDNCVMLVDECQNMTMQELNTIMTRVGKNSKIIFSGDIRQIDLNKRNDLSGLADFIKILNKMKSFHMINFTPEDICRSELVKDYIMTRMKLEDENQIKPL